MKKQFLFLAGTAIILASCASNNENPAQTQAQIDSAVNAKMAEHDAENAAKNDSTLRAMEKEKAEAEARAQEAEAAAAKGGKTKTKTKTTTTTTTVKETPPPAPAPTVGNGKPKMNEPASNQAGKENTIGNGKPKMK